MISTVSSQNVWIIYHVEHFDAVVDDLQKGNHLGWKWGNLSLDAAAAAEEVVAVEVDGGLLGGGHLLLHLHLVQPRRQLDHLYSFD